MTQDKESPQIDHDAFIGYIVDTLLRWGIHMLVSRISSRAFNQDAGRAKKASANGPVIITDRGKPSHVLLTYEVYLELTGSAPTIAELMYMPGVADIDLVIPPRAGDKSREVDLC